MSSTRILILNGPNLNLLGTREPGIYGDRTLDSIVADIRSAFPEVVIDHHQSNMEGELVERIQKADGIYSGVVLNAGGYAHTSISLRDAVAAVKVAVVEVHLSNLLAREPYRHTSLIGSVCEGSIMGFGPMGYHMAVRYIAERG